MVICYPIENTEDKAAAIARCAACVGHLAAAGSVGITWYALSKNGSSCCFCTTCRMPCCRKRRSTQQQSSDT